MTAPTLTSHTTAGVRVIEAQTPAGVVATAYGTCDGWIIDAAPIEVVDEIDARALLAALCGVVAEMQHGRAVVAS